MNVFWLNINTFRGIEWLFYSQFSPHCFGAGDIPVGAGNNVFSGADKNSSILFCHFLLSLCLKANLVKIKVELWAHKAGRQLISTFLHFFLEIKHISKAQNYSFYFCSVRNARSVLENTERWLKHPYGLKKRDQCISVSYEHVDIWCVCCSAFQSTVVLRPRSMTWGNSWWTAVWALGPRR